MPSIRKVAAFAKKTKPKRIICGGDLLDKYLLSTHAKRHFEAMRSTEIRKEVRQAVDCLALFAEHSRDKMLWLKGNHDDRFDRRLDEVPGLGIYLDEILDGESVYDLIAKKAGDNVEFVPSGDVVLPNRPYADIWFRHGDRSAAYAGGAAIAGVRDSHLSVVQGHTHAAGGGWVVAGKAFGYEAGHLADPTHYAFGYDPRARRRFHKWSRAFFYVDRWGRPNLVSMN